LVAEDNPVNKKLLRRMLEVVGYSQITVVSDGREAFDATTAAYEAGAAFDVIFMDCMMPIMSGYEASRAIREFEQAKGHTRSVIVAVTANATSADMKVSTESGMDGFVSKPITRDQLSVISRTWLSKAPRYRDPRDPSASEGTPGM
jgi:CheY-like chemotaxis protein